MMRFSLSPHHTSQLQELWHRFNISYFHGALPRIDIVWSHRLTSSAGLFVSRTGPRSDGRASFAEELMRRCIRLSLPLLGGRRDEGDLELPRTLAHEMIHQWQYDVLKRRPTHGADFRRMMDQMNQDGLGITIYHALARETDAFARYAWRCQTCGHIYRRQRRTIQPRRHQCGTCRGPLREVNPSLVARHSSLVMDRQSGRSSASPTTQLQLDFSVSGL